uniref:Prophenoloxidase n=1 Tax=Procambarus clarkii TaxID=6728 RepID=A6N2H3_PROCL|nr:prophenoloxidase [Procambarus clarkii]
MHQQMIARYDMERLSVNLKRVEKLENWREPIPDGYFSKLTVNNSGRPWGTRQDNTLLKDLRRNEFGLDVTDISDMELWRSRLMDAIHQGYMLNRNGERIPLSDNVTTGKRGIDILADAFEADGQLSPNFLFYGDLHNIGHHWHWHLVYPIDTNVNRDRKGELFYYMHQQMIARYDMERLSVNLKRVEKLENWREPIPDGYFSKLTVNNSGRPWGTRQDNTLLKDLRRNEFGLDVTDISDMELWRSRLMDAIHQGYMLNRNGERIPLSDNVTTGKRGIDILADAFEADGQLSPNFLFHGDLHNIGHLMLAFCHDSDNAHREEMGVVGDNTTAMRDPVFYRWHKFVDDVFQEYKLTQPPYTMEDLTLPGVVLDKVGVVRDNQLNTLTTGWNVREFEASRGLDLNSTNPVMLRITHLDHAPFDYHLQITNNTGKSKSVTVRIFMAPKHNERDLEMGFMEQRLLWAEMDRFTEILKPGKNQIVRPSSESSITTSSEFTFRSLEAVNPAMPGAPQNTEANFCGCGWPDHLLLPRSKPEGMTYQLFFMLTDLDKDEVDQPAVRRCADAVSFCGILDAKFPDKRPMGFPFDRRPPPSLQDAEVTSAADYARLGNITIQDITITFLNNNLQKSNN